jgi:hypothetical protein
MTEGVQIALIVSIPPTLLSLASLVSTLRNGGVIREVQRQSNGQSKALNELTAKSSFAEGKKSEKDNPS